MKIILEGPDNSGKTTLGRRLVKETHVPYFHPGGAPRDLDHERECCKEQCTLLHMSQGLVMDRCTPISQMVFNSDPARNPYRANYLRQMINMQALVLYCRPSTDRLLRTSEFTWREDESEEHKAKIITRAHEWITRYDEIMLSIPHLTYDFDSPHAEIVVRHLAGWLINDPDSVQWIQNTLNFRKVY